jgi:hypothetical protein
MFYFLSICILLLTGSGKSYSAVSNRNSKEASEEFYRSSQTFLQKNDLEKAKAFLRTAVRLDNSSYLSWNDLGVTEMRSGQLRKAYRRLQRASELNPIFETTKKNLEELIEFVSSLDYDPQKREEILSSSVYRTLYPQNQLHKIKEIPTYSKEQFESEENVEKMLETPFVIRNFLTLSDETKQFYDLSNLKKVFKDVQVDFYPHNMIEEQSRPYYKPLHDAIDQLIEPSEPYYDVDISEPGSYIQWNLLASHFKLMLKESGIQLSPVFNDSFLLSHSNCFGSSPSLLDQFYLNTHWKMLLIGEKGAGIFHHQDTLLSPTFQILLNGIKQWHLCSNSYSSYLYSAGEVNMFSPDYKKFPKVKKVKCYQFNTTVGDLLYYPGDYWHQTVNFVTPTIGLTGTFITKKSVSALTKELRKECSGANRLFVNEEKFCSQLLTKCIPLWEKMLLLLSASTEDSSSSSSSSQQLKEEM